MRVLHVYSGNLFGGIETMLLTLARLRGLCPAIESEIALVFDGRLGAELASTGIALHKLPEVRASRPHTIRAARRALAQIIASGGYDRVICHAAWSQAMFGGIVKRTNVPLVYWAHDVATGTHWTERLARRVRPDLAIANSRYTAESLKSLYSELPAIVLTYPIDTTARALSPLERAAVRCELHTPADALVIIQVSRMEAWKGHAVVIEALGRLRRHHLANDPAWVWWVVGGAQRPDEATYAEGLREAARRHGIEDRVRWLGERHDVPRLLGSADVHCQANASPEPFGIAYVEALAAGLPVVAARAGGVMEIVDDSCGVLVPPGDPVELAAALSRLLGDDEFRARLGAAAPARARQISDPATQLQRLADALLAMSLVGSPT